MIASTPIADLFRPIVGVDNVNAATADVAVDGHQPTVVVAPETTGQVADVLRCANDHGLAVLPRGGGTKQEWGNPPRRADLILSLHRMNRLLEHAYGDMTATVEAGMTLQDMQHALAEHGQMLALDPGREQRATLGGIVAADASGPLRIRYGTARDLVIGIGVALADGTTAQAGGKVVKNVAGYDLMKLFTGSCGTLGVITTITFRLHPIPTTTRSVEIAMPDARAAQELVIGVNHSTITPTGLQIAHREGRTTVAVRLSGIAASVEAQHAMLDRLVREHGTSAHDLDGAAAQDAWRAHERIFDQSDAIVARWAVVPTMLGAALTMMQTVASRLGADVEVVAQGTGTGRVRLRGASDEALLAALGTLRARLAEDGGNLVVQQCPLHVKHRFDVWGGSGDALELMQRVKAQFDPRGTLNPGRFVGRI